MAPQNLLTEGEVAGWLRIHPDTLKARRLRGEAPKHLNLSDKGKKPVIRYRREDVDAWVKRCRVDDLLAKQKD